MELSKINFTLPVISKEREFDKQFSRELCSSTCLLKKYDNFTYAIPGGKHDGHDLQYLFITRDSTIIKSRKYLKNELWKEFGFEYDISPEDQLELLGKIKDSSVEGLLPITEICNCSTEMPRFEGVLAETETNPVIQYHNQNYMRKEEWTEDGFKAYVDKTRYYLSHFHSVGIVHGDPCAHNILITSKSDVVFIDLDTIMPANNWRIERDYYIFYYFGIIPLAMRVLPREKYEILIQNILHISLLNKLHETSSERLFEENESNKNGQNTFLVWYLEFLFRTLKAETNTNIESQLIIRQLKVNVMETNRILNLKLEDSENDRAERLKIIEILTKQIDEIELDRSKRLELIKTISQELSVSEQDRAKRLEVIELLNKRTIELEDDHQKNLKIIEKFNRKLPELEEQLAERQETIEKIRTQFVESEVENNKQQKEMESLRKQLETSNKNYNDEISRLKQVIMELEDEKKESEQTLSSLQTKLDKERQSWFVKMIKK